MDDRNEPNREPGQQMQQGQQGLERQQAQQNQQARGEDNTNRLGDDEERNAEAGLDNELGDAEEGDAQ